MKSSSISRVLLGTALCLTLAVPAMAAEGQPAAAKPAAAGKPVAAKPVAAKPAQASSKKKSGGSKVASDSPEALQKNLDEFAQKTIASINRCVLPSSGKKEVKKNADGTFTARYLEIDPKSISTSYKTPDDATTVKYIGYMNYEEVEYSCTAGSHAEASKGPFAPKRRELMTELVKHVKGKWSY